MIPEPVEYQPGRPRRSVGAWMVLLAVWTVGLCSWTLYVAALFYAFIRLLT